MAENNIKQFFLKKSKFHSSQDIHTNVGVKIQICIHITILPDFVGEIILGLRQSESESKTTTSCESAGVEAAAAFWTT